MEKNYSSKAYDKRNLIKFVLPAFLLYTVFWVIPVALTVPISFTNWDGIKKLSDVTFVGLYNYKNIFTDDILKIAFINNIIYGLLMVAIVPVISFFTAFILDRYVSFKTFFRTSIYLPVILPSIVAMLLWRWIYNPTYGILNSLLEAVGLNFLSRGWIDEPATALFALTFTSIWKTMPFFMITILAGLQSVPKSLEESAIMDGAGTFKTVIHVIIPFMKQVLVVVYTVLLIDVFRVFELVYVMTDGGPGYYSTEMLLSYIFKTSFKNSLAGYGTAMSVILILIVMIINIVQLPYTMRSNEE